MKAAAGSEDSEEETETSETATEANENIESQKTVEHVKCDDFAYLCL